MTRRAILTALLTIALIGRVHAADTATALGDVFESRVAGIAFQPPAGGTRIRQTDSGYLIEFSYPASNWDLRVKVTQLSKPVPLSQEAAGDNPGGMLQMTADQTHTAVDVQSASVNDTLWDKPIGLILAHSNAGTTRVFTQTAIIPSDDSLTFYLLQFTSPGKAKNDPADVDPRELAAQDIFNRSLATVKLLDRAALRRDQVNRLYHTHEWLDMLDEKRITAAIEPDLYLRILRDGKDAGFVHVIEQPAARNGHSGIEVIARSHLVADRTPDSATAAPAAAAPVSTGELVPSAVVPSGSLDATTTLTVDRLAKQFVSFDRRHEDWTITTNTGGGPLGMVTTSELGNSDKEMHRVLDRAAQNAATPADAKDRREPHIREQDRYHLSVSYYARARSGAPVERDLPPFYLPEALGQLLPRLMPLQEPGTFMFASYVGEQREVMSRYVDVLPEQNVVLNEQRIVAVPVKDHVGVDGSTTTHYMTRDGRWLGSVNAEQKLQVLPTDRDTLVPIWKNALPPVNPEPAGR